MNVQKLLTEKQRLAFKLVFTQTSATALYGGSRSGKTFVIATAIILMCLMKKSRHLVLRKHLSTLISSAWLDTFPKVFALLGIPQPAYKFKGDRFYIKFANGSEIWFSGLDNKQRADKILGNEYTTIWINEASEFDDEIIPTLLSRLAEKSGWCNKIFFDFNPPETSHWSYELIMNQKLNGETIDINSILMNPADNKINLSPRYLKILEGMPERQRKRFLDGMFVSPEEALFHEGMINLEFTLPPAYQLVVIGVDPAATAKSTSDETGIIVTGLCHGKPYVLEDQSLRAAPDTWANRVIDAYVKYKAISVRCVIVAEVNMGGDMVYAVLDKVAKMRKVDIEYVAVRTSVSKDYRAEVLSMMMTVEKWYFAANFTFEGLRKQLLGYTSMMQNKKSPDRVDALIIAAQQLRPQYRKLLYYEA